MAALTLASGCFDADWEEASVDDDLHLVQGGGVGFGMTVTGGRKHDEVYLVLHAELTNLASDPCHLAIFIHSSEPVVTDLPPLTGPPAPAIPGAELVFETVLAPPSDGREFTRSLEYFDLLTIKLERDADLRRWITIATCEAPDVKLDLQVDLTVQFLEWRRSERTAAIDELWP